MRFIAILVAVWVLSRLVCAAIFNPLIDYNLGDASYYLEVARSIASGQGHSFNGEATLYRPPGYPLLLSGLLPALPWAAFIVQSLATLGAALLTAHRIPGRLGKLTALLIVTSPYFVAYEWRLVAEALLIPMLWSAWLLLVTYPHRSIVAGLIIGVAALLRETALLLPLFALPFAVLLDRPLARGLLVAFVAAYLVTVPWQLRNASLPGGSYTLSDGRAGFVLWVGTWDRNGAWMLPGVDNANYPAEAFRSPEEEARLRAAYRKGDDRAFRDVAINRITTNSISTGKAWLLRYPRLWLGTRADQIQFRPERHSAMWTAIKGSFWVLNALTFIAGLAGLALAIVRRRGLLPFALPILYIAAIYVPFYNAETRYSLPALPFIYLFTAYLLTQLRLGKNQIPSAARGG